MLGIFLYLSKKSQVFISNFLFNFVLIQWFYSVILGKFLEFYFLKPLFFLPYYFYKHKNFRGEI
ncbi:MAG TPA: hypothetical protein DDW46_07815 [Dehalococcoidia bacterium]|nr:hypothetical protein [Dehalococcoidia bacterium]